MNPKVHDLKVWTEFYEDVRTGIKPFEVRLNDRDFKVGELLTLRDYDNKTGQYTGAMCVKEITYVLHGGQWGVQEGYVVLGLKDGTVWYDGVKPNKNLSDKPYTYNNFNPLQIQTQTVSWGISSISKPIGIMDMVDSETRERLLKSELDYKSIPLKEREEMALSFHQQSIHQQIPLMFDVMVNHLINMEKDKEE